MKVGVMPENVIERLVVAAGAVPTPLFDTMFTAWQAAAGPEPERPLRFRTAPGIGQQAVVERR